ncbi:sensor histidine kinase [Sphaerisporangium perillae]|uniref:sensor histidine kinase n=1 Tax=Sphaerisporangium perillae TaxID=2935860 RepID=UPI00200D5E56|nr:HAMP domain-containing sensor histidine kinase [Sphaerisporangium perillae]
MPIPLPDSPCRPRLWRPRSIRGRVTALVALLAMLLLVPSGVLAGMVARQELANAGWLDARRAAGLMAAADRAGRLTDPIVTSSVPGANVIQVVAPDRKVIASSPDARGLAPLSTLWPTAEDPQRDVQTCANARLGCVRLSAARVSPDPGSNVVYAGGPVRTVIATGVFDALFAIQVAALISLAIWAAWKISGRTLRPVETIRAELAATNVNNLSSRVPEPPGDDEIARLARTVNGTLERLESAKDRMELALAAQRQFASDASHELRTPVAGLRAQLEEARMHPEDTDLEDLLDRTLRDVDRLQAIMTDLLLLAKLNGGTPSALAEVDLAESVRMEVSRRTDRLPVRLRLVPEVAVRGVDTQIARVLTNLLDNAQRHAKRGVLVEVRRDGRTAELVVSDDGDGIAEADRERIFERFTRLDASRCRDRGGTGLGLAIVRDIVRAHGGTIGVDTAEAGGARFTVRLPLDEPPADEPATPGMPPLPLAAASTH